MISLVKWSGYSKDLETRNRFTYIISCFSVALVTLFLFFYIIYVKELIVILMTCLCLLDFFIVFFLLKKRFLYSAKILMLFGFLFQEFSLIFLWFPANANFNYFLFIVAPIAFFIFDFDILRERMILIISNTIAVAMLLLSELIITAPVVELSADLARFFTVISLSSTIGSILIVFYFYASNLSSIHKELHLLANTDVLTKVYNRRTLYKEGEAHFALANKYNKKFGFIILDIDFFKNINDKYGHPAGDSILIQITELISANIRQNDILARYGGEEFALLLKDSSEQGNINAAEHLRAAVENHRFPVSKTQNAEISISIGVVHYSEKYSNFEQMLQQADKALYKAKENGRNMIVQG